jgi:hypothetical protein
LVESFRNEDGQPRPRLVATLGRLDESGGPLDALWHELGFDRLGAVFRRARFTTAIEQAIRAMVFNRLCDPEFKLGMFR